MTAWLEGLNEQQAIAVKAPLENALVLAGAGSGKTRVLVSRIASLVHHYSILPQAILAVTFTNKAAAEMKHRLSLLLDTNIQQMWVGTFHGLCHRLLRRHYEAAKLPEQFRILDSDDQGRLIKRVIQSLNLDTERWPVKQAQQYINSKKDEGLRSRQVSVPSFGPGKTLNMIYQAYEQLCFGTGVLDFAEILLRTHELLRDNADLLAHYQQRFRAILIDEFQDTNAIQYAWIQLLAGGGACVMAVGDDDQSIYGWRGAKVENIQKFSRDFLNTQLIRLEQNYRSTAVILKAANALIAHNDSRMGKDLWTSGEDGEKIQLYAAFNEIDEARFAADTVRQLLRDGQASDDIAILYRSNAQSRVLEEALMYAGVGYKIHGGLRFFERAEIKDMLAYLRLLVNPSDDLAFERVVNFPARGIGDKTIESLRIYASLNQCSLWEAHENCCGHVGGLSQRAQSALMQFKNLIMSIKTEIEPLALESQIQVVMERSGLYDHYFNQKQDYSESKQENLKELINAARQFQLEEEDVDRAMGTLASFLAYTSLESGEILADGQAAAISLMTLHAAKGLEFPIVFIVGLEDGLFPSAQSLDTPLKLEEERRLCYVGMTRAEQKLYLSYAKLRRQYGREERHRPSRFINEIPNEFLLRNESKLDVATPTSKMSSTTLKKNNNEIEGSPFQIGQWIMHKTFGKGIILNAEGNGAHTRVQVKFLEQGVKWLVLAYAQIELLES